jgi:hypothetical protein
MSARFVDKRIISTIDELSSIERDQLQVAGKFYDGDDRPAEDRLADGVDEGDGSLFDTELWKVVDGDRHLYDAWLYMGDSGTIFRAGTTEDVAMVIQCGLECEDPEIRAQLGPAMVEARLLPESDASYAEFAAMLAAQGGVVSEPAPEEEEEEEAAAPAKPKAANPAAKTPAAKKPAAKKPAAKKPAAKPAAKKPAAKKPAAKPAPKKPATKKPAAKKPAKAAAKKPAAKKPAKRR